MTSDNISYERYSRQVALPELGETGQRKLLQAKVVVAGAGGLGSAALQYLAAAGVGTIGIIDDDTVALHNLHRQPLYSMKDIGAPKVEIAAQNLQALNPDVTVIAHNERLTVANALELLGNYDIVIDGTDNFATRYMINDACVLLGKPLVYGAVSKFEGQVTVFNVALPGEDRAVNYRDLFPEPPAAGEVANCAETGVLGVLPGIIGTLQAGETIKLITGIGTALINSLFTYNALNNQVFEWRFTPRSNTAALLPKNASAFEKTDYNWLCGMRDSMYDIDTTTFNQLRIRNNVTVIDVREPGELPLVNEFPHSQIPLGRLSKEMGAVADDTVIVFCQSGTRSLEAAALMTDNFGHTKKIYSLAGGILQWKKNNHS